MSKKRERKNKKKIIIPIVIAVMVIIGIIILVKLLAVPKTTGTEWGDAYKDFLLKQSETRTEFDYGTENLEGYFIKTNSTDEIYMIVEGEYKSENNEVFHNTHIVSQDSNKEAHIVNIITNKEEKSPTSIRKIEYLYDRETKKVDWYIVSKQFDNGNITHIEMIKIKDYIEFIKKGQKLAKEMIEKYGDNYYSEEEYKNLSNEIDKEESEMKIKFSNEQLVDNEFGISEYSKRFIDLTDKIDVDNFDIDLKAGERNIVNLIKDAVNDYEKGINKFDKEVEKIISKEDKKIEEALKKQEKAEQEAAKKAEEEAAKKAQEEVERGMKVDGKTVRYGTYKEDEDYSTGAILVLNKGGTCTYDGKSCTY